MSIVKDKMKKYEYRLTVIKENIFWRIKIDNTAIEKLVKQSYGLKTGDVVSNLGAFLNYLDTLR